MTTAPSLEEYIQRLNELALKLDHRNNVFVPPRGLVLTVQCDKGKTIIHVATGLGGIVELKLPPGLVFKCNVIKNKKRKPILDFVTTFFSRKK